MDTKDLQHFIKKLNQRKLVNHNSILKTSSEKYSLKISAATLFDQQSIDTLTLLNL